MGFLPLNILLIIFFALWVIWGWEGEEMRQFFAVISSIAMLPLWTTAMFSLSSDTGGCCTIAVTNGWLPSSMLFWVLWLNLALMYFTGAHLMETLGYTDPIGKGLKRLRKPR